MNRVAICPRLYWQARVEEAGLTFHSLDGRKYWDESAYYQLTAQEVDALEKAANELHLMCIQAAQKVIDDDLWPQLAIAAEAIPLIRNSWQRDDFSLYGRFDFIYDGRSPPKMLEYNADTPTSLLETAAVQWFWLQDVSPKSDQFNSVHEKLVSAWKHYGTNNPAKVHLGSIKDCPEEQQTVRYLQDTCVQAGLTASQLFIEDLGFDEAGRRFVDLEDEPVRHYFKLYPWEWMWQEPFARCLKLELASFIEPMWKMLLSNKGLLPVLWQLFPDHPNLLPAFFSQEELAACPQAALARRGFIKKPKLGREGANISLVCPGFPAQQTEGGYGQEGYIFQALAPQVAFDQQYPVMGVWVVNHQACGLGIREDTSRITGNLSRFVPHLF